MYVCMCVCVYVCMHVCMHACMYVCMYLCMYLRTRDCLNSISVLGFTRLWVMTSGYQKWGQGIVSTQFLHWVLHAFGRPQGTTSEAKGLSQLNFCMRFTRLWATSGYHKNVSTQFPHAGWCGTWDARYLCSTAFALRDTLALPVVPGVCATCCLLWEWCVWYSCRGRYQVYPARYQVIPCYTQSSSF